MDKAEIMTMDNNELVTAIQDTWALINRSATAWPHYQATVDHYKALLKEQERRATARKDANG